MKVRFTTVRFGEGYAQDEVDAYLDRLEPVLRSGDGSITTEQVRGERFTRTRFGEGYAMDEVDAFLDDVVIPVLEGTASFDPDRDHTGADLRSGGDDPDRQATQEQVDGMFEDLAGRALSGRKPPGFLARLLGRG